ncbi:kinase-like domain-containing protein [Mycena vitilis]|nr:kinase-like domain-containing protein [Mycena vitilis]
MEAGPSSISEIWGYLEPLVNSPNVHRINFTQLRIDIGRSEGNDATFTGRAVSNSHATIEWNGRRDAMSVVTITDLNTTNGTFVDGEKVAGINTHRLFDGCTVFFGSKVPVVTEQEDYRFTFHHSYGRAKTESLFNHYIMGNCLGSGLHGHVYRAMEKRSGKVFAVKTSWHYDNKDSIMSAGQETMALMVMEFTHIVKLHEVFFRLDGQITDMVMEYVDGGLTLHNFIPLHLSETHAKELSIQLCLAVAFVHENTISHGDLKPDNVLVTRETHPIIKVTDFGLADVKISYNRKPLKTDHIFTAPEVQSQDDPDNAEMQKWDDWAVGCLIFSLLSTFHAFPPGRGKAFDPYVDRIVWDALNTCSDEAQDLVRRFLAVNPDNRVSNFLRLGSGCVLAASTSNKCGL